MTSVDSAHEFDSLSGGFATVDEKGRVSLPKTVRGALGVTAGSSVAYVVLDGALLLIPQDQHLAELMDSAAQVLSAAGLTVQDFLDDLPAVRAEVFKEAYGEEFLREMEALRAELRSE